MSAAKGLGGMGQGCWFAVHRPPGVRLPFQRACARGSCLLDAHAPRHPPLLPLQARTDDSGAKLVELPRDWAVQLERLFRQRREEYATLQGWLGPRRFEGGAARGEGLDAGSLG